MHATGKAWKEAKLGRRMKRTGDSDGEQVNRLPVIRTSINYGLPKVNSEEMSQLTKTRSQNVSRTLV